MDYISQFLKIGRISGMFYKVKGRKAKRIVVYGIGAPMVPDSGMMKDASFILDFDTDLYVPDYLGYGRSEGRFTPLNCVKIFLQLYEALSQGCEGICHYEGLRRKLKYKEIYFIGSSFGGAYVSLLPRFNKKITNLGLVFPVVNWANIGKKPGEEAVKHFYAAMNGDGYKYLYRGVNSRLWKKHFQARDGLSPINNVEHLKDAKVFIGHGKKDKNISYKNSVNYYEKLLKRFPKQAKNFRLKLYPGDHSEEVSNKAVVDYLKFMGVQYG